MILDFEDGDRYFVWTASFDEHTIIYRLRNGVLQYFEDKYIPQWTTSSFRRNDIGYDRYFVTNSFREVPIHELVLMDLAQ